MLFCLLYKYLTNKKKSTSFTFHRENELPFIQALNRLSDVLAADWLSETRVKNYRNFHIFKCSEVEISIKHSILSVKKR